MQEDGRHADLGLGEHRAPLGFHFGRCKPSSSFLWVITQIPAQDNHSEPSSLRTPRGHHGDEEHPLLPLPGGGCARGRNHHGDRGPGVSLPCPLGCGWEAEAGGRRRGGCRNIGCLLGDGRVRRGGQLGGRRRGLRGRGGGGRLASPRGASAGHPRGVHHPDAHAGGTETSPQHPHGGTGPC